MGTKINWKVRAKHPMFWLGLVGAVGTPTLAYMGIAAADLTTWDSVGKVIVDAVSNPYLFGITVLSALSFLGIATDPTTVGLSDSARALRYTEPNDDTAGLR